ncbi:MAG: chorismate mutase [Actinomycetia bacterium]|nr:chorismate mutase [Actinomycetes bacterium]
MDIKQELDELRSQVDEIDREIVPLFVQRMALSLAIGKAKGRGNMSVLNQQREQQIIDQALEATDQSIVGETALLMRTIIALSREHQYAQLMDRDRHLLPKPRKLARDSISCAYQGVPGSWSEQALLQVFPDAHKEAVDFFEDVFLAVRDGNVDYGVVPIENSTTGAIGETYDLLRKYGCFIVGRTSVRARQCLLAAPGTRLNDIREVLSHPEGFKQCSGFLHNRAWDLTATRNTAVAAETVAKKKSSRFAAIGSRRAAELNELAVIATDIMDSDKNTTSFVVIAANPEYDESSDIITITFSTAHRAGALCEALLPYLAHEVNMLRIESRPSEPGKYRFFADLAGNINDDVLIDCLLQAKSLCEYIEVLGCYSNKDAEE